MVTLIDGDPPSSPRTAWLPAWVWRVLLLAALILIPWSLWLAFTLPRRTAAYHWAAAWAGFDLLLSISLALTALAVWRRAPWALAAAGATAAMLVSDAWFDVMTSSPLDRVAAIVAAIVFEIPLAFVCVWLARRAGRTIDRGQKIADRARGLRAARAIRVSRKAPLP